ncbi:MAG: TfoX/Sxy family protein [Patescibacteria group bacterium]
MSTSKSTISFILEKLGNNPRFSARAMFGEYALYADGKVVALVCDDQLYVKICPASVMLEKMCDKDAPYPGAKLHFAIGEDQIDKIVNLPEILFAISTSLPAKKKYK